MKVNCYLCFLGANGLVRDVLSHANVMIQAFVQVPIMTRSHICHCQPVWRANHLSPTPEKVAMAIAGQEIFPTKDKKQEWTTATEVWPSPPSIRSTLERFCLLIYLFYFCVQHQRRHRLEGKNSWLKNPRLKRLPFHKACCSWQQASSMRNDQTFGQLMAVSLSW